MKKSNFLCLMMLATFFISVNAFANSFDLRQWLQQTQTLQANFSQAVYDNRNKLIQQAHGRMFMQRPGKLRWEVKKPIPQIIVANNNKLWIYDPDLEQVSIRRLNKVAGEAPALLLSQQNSKLETDFTITPMQTKNANEHWLTFTPKHADNMFEYIQMGFQQSVLKQMRLKDNLGHLIVIQFRQVKVNSALSAALFNFKPPPNVDVVDETH